MCTSFRIQQYYHIAGHSLKYLALEKQDEVHDREQNQKAAI